MLHHENAVVDRAEQYLGNTALGTQDPFFPSAAREVLVSLARVLTAEGVEITSTRLRDEIAAGPKAVRQRLAVAVENAPAAALLHGAVGADVLATLRAALEA